jgi:DNA polymerase III subunit alpha
MLNVTPIFKSHYSIGRSILTIQNPEDAIPNGPDSIIQIAQEAGINKLFLAEDSMAGFLEAYSNCKSAKIDLVFGLRLTVCRDMLEKNEESRQLSSKYIVFARNTKGYQKLIKIYSSAAKEGFYYEPRTDFNFLKGIWSEKDLMLVAPFYDSFIYKNVFSSSFCVPELDFTTPVFFLEDNLLPFDALLEKSVLSFCADTYPSMRTKSIYYKSRKDFKSYLTFRCINSRSKLDKPELSHMCSDEFCLESWMETQA